MKKRERRNLNRELPQVGTKLIKKYRGVIYNAKIVNDKTKISGKSVEYSGVKYRTMTAAAVSITKHATNGWAFWKIKKEK